MRKLLVALACTAALVGASCAKKNEPSATTSGAQSIALGTYAKTVRGDVATFPIVVHGLTIVKADGSSSHKKGHFHVFVDREMVDVGKVIPKEKGIVHTADNPIKVYGLTPGEHTFHIVVGDGQHRRFGEKLHLEATVKVLGPSVQGSAPATITKGQDLTVKLKAEGVTIKKADGDTSGKTGHFHVLVDPATPPKAGDVIPAAVPNKIIHTAESSTTISGLSSGEHIIWVVLGDGVHRAFDPPVMAKLTVTVV